MVHLGELKVGESGKIVKVTTTDPMLALRFSEMGMFEGSEVKLLFEAPFGRDPIAVRVRGMVLALRRNEANQIEVIKQEGGSAQ